MTKKENKKLSEINASLKIIIKHLDNKKEFENSEKLEKERTSAQKLLRKKLHTTGGRFGILARREQEITRMSNVDLLKKYKVNNLFGDKTNPVNRQKSLEAAIKAIIKNYEKIKQKETKGLK